MDLQAIHNLLEKDLAAVDALIEAQLHSTVPLIKQLSDYIIQSGGKRLRPMVALLSARSLQGPLQPSITVAVWIELIHTATLLHDDVVDASEKRRGKATAHTLFGNAASILVGDFIYTRAFQLMMELQSLPLLKLMAKTTHQIAEGEVLQLTRYYDATLTEVDYWQIIDYKTASLFAAAAQSGALLTETTTTQQQALQAYGYQLGRAFQLVDDWLDYQAQHATFGKNVGDDLQEGKLTLPLLHALQQAPAEQSSQIRQAIEQRNGRDSLSTVCAVMQQCGSLDYVKRCAEAAIAKAIESLHDLPVTPYRQALAGLASSVLQPLYYE
jgi:octaprenyl-diphosphate synthase